jgi:hypothetical protein
VLLSPKVLVVPRPAAEMERLRRTRKRLRGHVGTRVRAFSSAPPIRRVGS